MAQAIRYAGAVAQEWIPGFLKDLFISFLKRTRKSLTDPYRPELHYMRGPGPKWRERHGRSK